MFLSCDREDDCRKIFNAFMFTVYMWVATGSSHRYLLSVYIGVRFCHLYTKIVYEYI